MSTATTPNPDVHPRLDRAWDGTPAALSEPHLERYLAHLGVDRPAAPTTEALGTIQLAHLYGIPFENLDTVLGVPIELGHDRLVEKLLSGARGGYCYEHNMLLAGALVTLGYGVAMHAARSLMGVGPGPLPRTHVALRVTPNDGDDRFVDVGFGRATLTTALPVSAGEVVESGGDRYRFALQEGELALQSSRRGGPWVPMYLLDQRPVYPIDIAMANHFVSTHPDSPLGIGVRVLQATPEGKRSLSGTTLIVDEGERQVHREIAIDEFAAVLRDEFRIVLPNPPTVYPG